LRRLLDRLPEMVADLRAAAAANPKFKAVLKSIYPDAK
jgi:hypothetical protein